MFPSFIKLHRFNFYSLLLASGSDPKSVRSICRFSRIAAAQLGGLWPVTRMLGRLDAARLGGYRFERDKRNDSVDTFSF